MIVNGNEIAAEIKRELSAKVLTLREVPRLAVFFDEENTVGTMYVGRKEAFAKEIGVKVEKIELAPEETTEQLTARVAAKGKEVDGIVVQMPLPKSMDTDKVLGSIPVDTDVDILSPEAIQRFEHGLSRLLPPVIGAMKLLIDQYTIHLEGLHAVVVGEGRLVGAPAAVWLKKQGARVVTVNDKTQDVASLTKSADVIVLGAGSPGLLLPDMIKDDVLIFDAGATIVQGKVQGDANPACAEKAKIFTPVPGGLGPMGIACAFQNLVFLAEHSNRNVRE